MKLFNRFLYSIWLLSVHHLRTKLDMCISTVDSFVRTKQTHGLFFTLASKMFMISKMHIYVQVILKKKPPPACVLRLVIRRQCFCCCWCLRISSSNLIRIWWDAKRIVVTVMPQQECHLSADLFDSIKDRRFWCVFCHANGSQFWSVTCLPVIIIVVVLVAGFLLPLLIFHLTKINTSFR